MAVSTFWLLGREADSVRGAVALLVGWAFWMYAKHQHLALLHGLTDRQLVDTDRRLVEAEQAISELRSMLDAATRR